ncbi:MAG: DUF1592 domain-containing protein [Deltaproteobacteria bacterium]|nr:DUF1592 domain-containing protein [Nannocystaceae bacterium]
MTGTSAWMLAAWLPVGCYTGLEATTETAGASDEHAGEDGGDGDGSEDVPDREPDACPQGAAPLALRYLTRIEYENTIRDIYGAPMDVAAAFAPDESAAGYFANSEHAPSSTQLEMFLDTAEQLARIAVTERFDHFVPCQPAQPGCAKSFITAFGRRAFRRPLTVDELDAYSSDFEALAAEQGDELALEVVVTAMLASPHFLYVGERSELVDDTARAYDLASRLSYFVWASMPDELLMSAAASGTLSTAAGVEAQARRMLADDRAADMLTSFSTQWLEVGGLAQSAPKQPEQFPQWTEALAQAAERETSELMRRVVLGGDARLASLLQSREAYVDPSLAALYGVEPPAGGHGWVMLPEHERAGLLTRSAFLARHAHATQNSWVHRGKLVRERLLCGTLPPPPPVADDSPINDDSRLQDPACSGCHTLMDPIGIGFEGYDPIGTFVGGSAPGRVEGIAAPEFDGALELSERLASLAEVHRCFAVQMFGYANRRVIGSEETCAVEAMATHFAESDGDILELIVELAVAEAFTNLGGG